VSWKLYANSLGWIFHIQNHYFFRLSASYLIEWKPILIYSIKK